MPIPVRWAAVCAVILGALGGVVGLVLGLRTYVPTAWAATFEVGLPSAALGAVLGLAAGSVVVVSRRSHLRHPPAVGRPAQSQRRFGSMASTSQHISIGIDRPASEVYAVAADPLNLPRWAAGLAGSEVERDGDRWFTDSPMGRVTFTFAPRNDFGVLDHDVTLPSGETVHNPLRVIGDGDGCEVVFTLRRRPGMSDEELARDAEAVAKDLEALKALVENG